MNGLVRRNTYVKYESPTFYKSKVMTMVIAFQNVGKTPRSKVRESRS
jgi:hypothetical protein